MFFSSTSYADLYNATKLRHHCANFIDCNAIEAVLKGDTILDLPQDSLMQTPHITGYICCRGSGSVLYDSTTDGV